MEAEIQHFTRGDPLLETLIVKTPVQALVQITGYPICRENQVSSKDTFFSEQSEDYVDLQRFIYYGPMTYPLKHWPHQQIICEEAEKLSRFFPEFDFDGIKSLLLNESLSSPMDQLVNESCPGEQWTGPKPNYRIVEGTDEDIWAEIDSHLESGNIAGVSYYPDFILSGGDSLLRRLERKKAHGRPGRLATIVGKGVNCNEGKNVYVLRVNQGAEYCNLALDIQASQSLDFSFNTQDCNCVAGPSEIEMNRLRECETDCFARKREEYLQSNKPAFTCTDDGHFVVDAELLKRASYEATLLK